MHGDQLHCPLFQHGTGSPFAGITIRRVAMQRINAGDRPDLEIVHDQEIEMWETGCDQGSHQPLFNARKLQIGHQARGSRLLENGDPAVRFIVPRRIENAMHSGQAEMQIAHARRRKVEVIGRQECCRTGMKDMGTPVRRTRHIGVAEMRRGSIGHRHLADINPGFGGGLPEVAAVAVVPDETDRLDRMDGSSCLISSARLQLDPPPWRSSSNSSARPSSAGQWLRLRL